MTGAPVLIVDDHPINLKLVRVLLTAQGLDVRTAGSAAEAMAVIDEVRPALVLMDIQLPDLDGLELTRRLREDPALAAIPIVAVTAYAMKGDAERTLAAGCTAYVSKPIDTRALAALVTELLAAPSGDRGDP